MSYDLYLSSPQLSREAFERYFEGRPNYQEVGVYTNEVTGVYFHFEYVNPDAEEKPDEDSPEILRGRHVAFSLNFFRPHIFALEAEPELTAFVKTFRCEIHDPQFDGLGDGPYNPEGFLRGWTNGNASGYAAMMSEKLGGGADGVVIADDEAIELVWRWNRELATAQAAFSGVHFFPRVYWAKQPDSTTPIAFAIWGEGIATAIPQCATHVLLGKKHRAGLTSLFGSQKNTIEYKLLTLQEVAALTGCRWQEVGSGRVLLTPNSIFPNRSVTAAFAGGFGAMSEIATAVPYDRVLNSSLVAQSRKQNT